MKTLEKANQAKHWNPTNLEIPEIKRISPPMTVHLALLDLDLAREQGLIDQEDALLPQFDQDQTPVQEEHQECLLKNLRLQPFIQI